MHLAIETATAQVSCAIGDQNGILASFQSAHVRCHVEELVPAIAMIMKQAGVTRADFNAIAVDHGPGLFTGLRVGVATARGLATAWGLPLIGVSSLEALAFAHYADNSEIVSVVDAKRSEVFWQAFFCEGETIRPLTQPRVSEPDHVHRYLHYRDRACRVVGDGTPLLIRDDVAHHVYANPTSPSADAICALSWCKPAMLPMELTVEYMRKSDAEVIRDEKRVTQ